MAVIPVDPYCLALYSETTKRSVTDLIDASQDWSIELLGYTHGSRRAGILVGKIVVAIVDRMVVWMRYCFVVDNAHEMREMWFVVGKVVDIENQECVPAADTMFAWQAIHCGLDSYSGLPQ